MAFCHAEERTKCASRSIIQTEHAKRATFTRPFETLAALVPQGDRGPFETLAALVPQGDRSPSRRTLRVLLRVTWHSVMLRSARSARLEASSKRSTRSVQHLRGPSRHSLRSFLRVTGGPSRHSLRSFLRVTGALRDARFACSSG